MESKTKKIRMVETERRRSKRDIDRKERGKGTGEEKAEKREDNGNKESSREMGNLE